MLVLSRKIDQSVLLPDLGVEFRVLKVRGNNVSIGIVAPTDVKILRGELAVASMANPKPRAQSMR